MAGIITKKLRLFNAEQLFESFTENDPTNVYMFIGRVRPWDDDGNPPTPIDSIEEIEYDPWKTMLSMKRVSPNDVSYAIPRIDWTSGTVYTSYSSSSIFQNGNFYVVTDDYNVYKCLDNNEDSASLNKPTGTGTSVITLADGYKWKYMYSISAGEALKFVSSSYIPVKYLSSDDGSPQWDVQTFASNGSIQTINVVNGGSNYQFDEGYVITSTNSTATIQPTSPGLNGSLVGSTISIIAGTGVGQHRNITSYDGPNRIATIDTNWSVNPDATSKYVISPKIEIIGDQSSNAIAYAEGSGGTITDVTVLSIGENYSYANTVISANSGSGAVLKTEISPRNGHGANSVSELYGHNVIMNVKTLGNESNTFMISNDFRIFGIIVDPLLANNSVATGTSYRISPVIEYNSASGSFIADEQITGGTSNATSIFVESPQSNNMIIVNKYGNYQNGETITGSISGTTATVTNVINSEINPYSGDIIYLEYRSPVSRAEDQVEDTKIIVRF